MHNNNNLKIYDNDLFATTGFGTKFMVHEMDGIEIHVMKGEHGWI